MWGFGSRFGLCAVGVGVTRVWTRAPNLVSPCKPYMALNDRLGFRWNLSHPPSKRHKPFGLSKPLTANTSSTQLDVQFSQTRVPFIRVPHYFGDLKRETRERNFQNYPDRSDEALYRLEFGALGVELQVSRAQEPVLSRGSFSSRWKFWRLGGWTCEVFAA